MEFLSNHLLSLILFAPTLGAVILLFLPAGRVKLLRWFTFGASLVPFALTLVAAAQFQAGKAGFALTTSTTTPSAFRTSTATFAPASTAPFALKLPTPTTVPA